MKLFLEQLSNAIDFIEEGSFEKALLASDQIIQGNKNNFWGWYLGAVSLAFLKENSSFYFYLENAKKILPNSEHLRYLKAYQFLLEDKESDALIEWAHLVDTNQGWFARQLLEKARKGRPLRKAAKSGNVGKFILLPNMKKEISNLKKNEEDRVNTYLQEAGKFKTVKRAIKGKYWSLMDIFKRLAFNKISLFSILCINLIILFLSFFEDDFFSSNLFKQNYSEIKLPAKIKILPENSIHNVSYKFSDEKQIYHEFEKAKRLLKNKKVNQTRYLLQRILHSNADFNTKSKCRTFIGFIPDLLVEEFDDPVLPDALSNEPNFYLHSQVLWEARLISKLRVKGGHQIEAVLRHKDRDYLISGFMPEKDSDQWQPYAEFQELKKEKNKLLKNIVFFGKFKGMLSDQKRLYVELSRVWL